MRRMSGGGAAGGGQIFNIGKSKAKLFDEKIETNNSEEESKHTDNLEQTSEDPLKLLELEKKMTLRRKILQKIEDLTGLRVGEYKNYRIL